MPLLLGIGVCMVGLIVFTCSSDAAIVGYRGLYGWVDCVFVRLMPLLLVSGFVWLG